ncbi:MAG: DUF3455 domain-containing protein [Betaproteobacteria bacterium]|nr:DUF3455 domain-containing protein [Betaproteobacteria bacterium]
MPRQVSLLAPAAFLALASCMNMPEHAKVPNTIAAPAHQIITREAMASGFQIYECRVAADDPARYQWVFKAPEAELYETAGNRLGRHYAGPTWEALDGSKVVGQLVAQAASPDDKAIPWLLLSARSTSGKGVFSRIESIQRVNTTGGKAPGAGCDQAHAGRQARVPYTATYYFYSAKP